MRRNEADIYLQNFLWFIFCCVYFFYDFLTLKSIKTSFFYGLKATTSEREKRKTIFNISWKIHTFFFCADFLSYFLQTLCIETILHNCHFLNLIIFFHSTQLNSTQISKKRRIHIHNLLSGGIISYFTVKLIRIMT